MGDRERPTDPGERFRELVTEWERGFDALANRFMGTDEFSRTMNQFQNLQLTLQKVVADVMGKQLAALNLPSREDVIRVGEAIHELDARVAKLERRLEDLARASGATPPRPRPGPPRTKRPPGSTGGQS